MLMHTAGNSKIGVNPYSPRVIEEEELSCLLGKDHRVLYHSGMKSGP